jgi:hypothetical protein
MTKCETRKQLSYSRLGTGISQENGGSNLPLVWQSLIVPSYWQILIITGKPILHVCPLQYSSRTLPATQFKPGLLADKLSEVQMSYFYLWLSVCQYLWIIKFPEWAYRKIFADFVSFRFYFVSHFIGAQ